MALAFDRGALKRYILRSIQDLPALPSVVVKVIELSDDPQASATQMEKIIVSDQAIAAKVLRVVNSAYYGLSAEVSTVSHAIVVLGFQQVRHLVLSMAAISLVSSRSPKTGLLQKILWRHSYCAAQAARLLAKRKDISHELQDLAHVGALLHDIGALFLLHNFTDLYTETLHVANEKRMPLEEVEERILGITHGEVGDYMTAAWHYPENLRVLIAKHHDPIEEVDNPALALVKVSDYLADIAGFAIVPQHDIALEPSVRAFFDLQSDEEAEIVNLVQEASDGADAWLDVV
jgi:HD-like signal output (HDOD) protein